MLEISKDAIERHLEALAKIGNLGPTLEDGFLRAAWSDEETAAIEYICDVSRAAGLVTRYDPLGNCFIRTPGEQASVVQIGSHLDTVPRGGNFDGVAGIVSGLEAIIAVFSSTADSSELQHGLELVIWRGEEGATFGSAMMGSKAAFGILPPETLQLEFRGKTLEEAIRSQGYDPELIAKGQPTLGPEQVSQIQAHFELHIEQGNKLEQDQHDIGIVTSIRGPRRFRIVVKGESAHSGATAMGPKFRKDANLAVAKMQVALDNITQEFIAQEKDIVQTIGVLNSDRDFNQKNPQIYDSAVTKVADFAYFLLDFRSKETEILNQYWAQAEKQLRQIASELNVELSIEKISEGAPLEALNQQLAQLASNCCQELQLKQQFMPSGAGHDVAVVAKQQRPDSSHIPCCLLFIPCRNGISHNPLEFTTSTAIQNGAAVLAAAIRHLAS